MSDEEKTRPPVVKCYLGDGVYACIDERGIVLTAENGIEATDTIVLDGDVWAALLRYVQFYER